MIEKKIKIRDMTVNFKMPEFMTESSKIDVHLYTLKPWQRFVPRFLYPLFRIYPTKFKKCEIVEPATMNQEEDALTITSNVSYQEIKK